MPIPTDLKELHVKTTEKILPCFKYPSKELIGKRYYKLLIIGETGSEKAILLDTLIKNLQV